MDLTAVLYGVEEILVSNISNRLYICMGAVDYSNLWMVRSPLVLLSGGEVLDQGRAMGQLQR